MSSGGVFIVLVVLILILVVVGRVWKILQPPATAPESGLGALVKEMVAYVKTRRAVSAFAYAKSWKKRKRIVEKHRDVLLTESAEEALDSLLTPYEVDEHTTAIGKKYRKVLARCRRVGIDAAFADRVPIAPDEIQRRIAACREALALIDRADDPEWWADLHAELGDNLQDPEGEGVAQTWEDVTQDIEEAISHYELAFEVRTKKDFPKDWARTQSNLAYAYSQRTRGDEAENEEEAISCYELALEVYTKEDFPEDWADTQTALATACNSRIRGDRAENLEQAISHCEQPLEVYTRKDFPLYWAVIQNILAKAYWKRIRGDREQNMEEVISRYEQALEIYTREDFPVQWAGTQHYLANVYRDRIRGEEARNLEEAISRYEQALQVYTREAFPVQWTTIRNDLAAAYPPARRRTGKPCPQGWVTVCVRAGAMRHPLFETECSREEPRNPEPIPYPSERSRPDGRGVRVGIVRTEAPRPSGSTNAKASRLSRAARPPTGRTLPP